MKVHGVRAMAGANFYSYRPVVRGVIDISDWNGKTTRELENFNEKLIACLPTLNTHTCSRGKPGGFIERLNEGTFPGHVMEHVAIELLALAGEPTKYGKTRLLDEAKHLYEVIYQYQCEEAAIEAFYMAVDLINSLRTKQTVDRVDAFVSELKQLRTKYLPGPSTKTILDACYNRGIPVQRLHNGSLYQLGYGRYQKKIQAAMTCQTPCIGVDIAGDKQLTRRILNDSAIPVPKGRVVHSEEELIACFEKFEQSVVIKPCQGNQGRGVSLNLQSENEVLAAFRLAEVYDSKVIIEEHIKGNNYRLLVINGKLAAAAQRIPPYVVGNGSLTIKELVEFENQNPLRGDGHENYLTKIALDSVVVMDLTRQGLGLTSVPSSGEKIMLRQSANLSTGSTAIDMTDRVHPDNAELAVYAAKILGMDVAGVDMIMDDISKPYTEQDGRIIEVNAAPGLRMHLKPSIGKGRDVGAEIIKMLFPHGNGRIPIVSVTGTNGKTTVVRLISKILHEQNVKVGMTCTEGIWINGKNIKKGDLSGPQSAKTVLRHPDVQAAVLETARGGILRSGLGYDYADIAVITNITEDHIGQDGIETVEELVKLKSLVAEMVPRHGYVVLNADDPMVMGMSRRVKGKVILFSTHIENRKICKHLAIGGSAVVVSKGKIMICDGQMSYTICHLAKIPLTWGGKAQHNVQNVLAAVAAGWALGYNAIQIRKALRGFGQQTADNGGRLEHYDLAGIKVILDYGHNPAGIREIIQTVRSVKPRRLIGCIGLPGDRSNHAVRQLAQEAAKGFDILYLKEDADLRGRNPGEIAGILFEEALAAGKKPNQLRVIPNEIEAFQQALEEAKDGDIVVVFYEKAEPLRKIVLDLQERVADNKILSGYNISVEV